MFLRRDTGCDPGGRFGNRTHGSIRRLRRATFAIAAVDPHGAAACGLARIHVAPAIAYHKAPARVDAVPGGAFEDQAGFGLAAGAGVAVVVQAGQEVVYWKRGGDALVN